MRRSNRARVFIIVTACIIAPIALVACFMLDLPNTALALLGTAVSMRVIAAILLKKAGGSDFFIKGT
jgi:hypothetical protein